MATKIKLPEFKGKALIEVPKNTPQADFLSGDFGKAVLEEYQGRASQDYRGAGALNVLSYSDGVVKGSNSPAIVLLNQILRPENLRTATQADLETVLRTGALDLKGFYEDSSLVLRSEGDPNSYLAKDLHSQVRERLGRKAKLPVVIPLAGLDLVNDGNSNYGLAFKLREDAKVIYAPILSEATDKFSQEDINSKTGLPKNLGNGSRTLYTPGNKTGLRGLNLDGGLGLGSLWCGGGLSGSDGFGRVVIVGGSGEAASRKLGQYTVQLNAAREEYHAKLSALQTAIGAELKSK